MLTPVFLEGAPISLCPLSAVMPELCGFQGGGLRDQSLPCRNECRLQAVGHCASHVRH